MRLSLKSVSAMLATALLSLTAMAQTDGTTATPSSFDPQKSAFAKKSTTTPTVPQSSFAKERTLPKSVTKPTVVPHGNVTGAGGSVGTGVSGSTAIARPAPPVESSDR